MTLRNRQSSLPVSASRRFQSPRSGCAQGAPKVVALRMPVQGVAGTGSCQREIADRRLCEGNAEELSAAAVAGDSLNLSGGCGDDERPGVGLERVGNEWPGEAGDEHEDNGQATAADEVHQRFSWARTIKRILATGVDSALMWRSRPPALRAIRLLIGSGNIGRGATTEAQLRRHNCDVEVGATDCRGSGGGIRGALFWRLGSLQDARITARIGQGKPDCCCSFEGQQIRVRLSGIERCSLLCFDFFAGR